MIPIADPQIGVPELSALLDVAERGQLADGPPVRTFEREFASACGAAHGVATSNGTTALHAALRALEIGPGDTVLTTPFSFVATANAIRLCGATPTFADIDPATMNLDPDAVRTTLRDREVDAILAVHLYGRPAPMDRLCRIAAEHDVPVIEDAAQAHGARFRGDSVGSLGDVACFSFYPTKNMTTGEGGIVLTDDERVAERAERFVNHGRTDTYLHDTVGHNFRLTSLGAAIGLAQLDRLHDFVAVRRRNAARYDDALADQPAIDAPGDPDHLTHSYHQYTVRCDRRAALREHLEAEGIGAGIYYPRPIHKQPAYADVDADAPAAETAAEEVLSVPVHPALDRAEVGRVADALEGFSP
ncbi:aminotransferase class I/II-fold pyridoxal phosphate-dependent enzyme [Halorubrum sp. JWXQ-INN 858]|uniref:DegT/DnrJ/EryC1/StrS family aminotransferase n=1 Tax=Halorubrum sp. JWXQ-INN 858 TaxID=2690782 RepID=UPI00135AC3BB|nr:DegT/DnrJ/EryC1/StrS family aminotransferase [Halorubrum sp. JWXQ-INN 858]MWV65472.1 aminotransferase class I/II-fold pyridoxal phosphate-dependent enzyme [Halorubrum sp. JWXQ-INN 858]